MSLENFPVGMELAVSYPDFRVNVSLLSLTKLQFEIVDGPFARIETVDIEVVPLRNSLFLVSWQEKDGATVTNLQDYDRGVIHSHATLQDGKFMRMAGTFEVKRAAVRVSDQRPHYNKALVLEAMTSLFQRRDIAAVERLYAQDYVQHNPDIPHGRDALKAIVATMSADVYYEPGLVIAEGDLVAIHGRIRGWSASPQVVVDIFRIEDGKLAEHWDVLQNEVSKNASTAGAMPMFDPEEGKSRA